MAKKATKQSKTTVAKPRPVYEREGMMLDLENKAQSDEAKLIIRAIYLLQQELSDLNAALVSSARERRQARRKREERKT